MNVPLNEHDWFTEQIATALAGGLSDAEQARFDAHANECTPCAAALAEAKMTDGSMAGFLSDLRPPDGLENRIIARLRSSRRILRLPGINHPMVFRAAAAAAAVIVVGSAGWMGTRILEKDSQVAITTNNLRQMGLSIGLYNKNTAGEDVLGALRKRGEPEIADIAGDRDVDKSRLTASRGLNDSYAYRADLEPKATETREAYGLKILPGGSQAAPVDAPALVAAPMSTFALDAKQRGLVVGGTITQLGTSGNALTGMNTYNGLVRVEAGAGGGRGGGGGIGGGGFGGEVPGQAEASKSSTLNQEIKELALTPNAVQPGLFQEHLHGMEAEKTNAPGALYIPPIPPIASTDAVRLHDVPAEMTPSGQTLQYALGDAAARKDQPAGVPPQPAGAAQPQMSAPTSRPDAMGDRKIIRSGTMRFEVENFDSADRRLREIVRESGGYIGSADSTRLPNGKVQGTITIRVPPENLDVLVLGLRALGDLQEQQIGAQDITKEYTDLQSELRAAKAMEDRLLEIIHTGNAQVKDLLAVEKELGNWREKVEQVTGQINYYNNLVSLSTLTVTLSEKDINQAATATETETINTGLEADDVSHARDEVIKAVEAAKGRIIQSDLNEQQAGQFTATVVALLPADTGGPIIDHLRQLGRITRLESTRKQTINGQQAPENVKVNRRDTQLQLSIFNVNAYAPRTSDNLALACTDVESAYHSILDFVAKSDHARVVESNLTRPSPDATTGVISFEVRESSADATLAFLRSLGVSRSLAVTENRDADSVTSSKRGFNIVLNPVNAIPAQETVDMTLLPVNGDLLAAYNSLLDLANQPDIKARIIDKDLQQANGMYTSAAVEMEVPRDKLDMAQQKITAAGKVVARKSTRQPDSANVIDTKVMLKFNFVNVDALEPRQTLVRSLAAADAPAAYQTILDAARAAGAWIRSADLRVQPGQSTVGELDFYLPAAKQGTVQDVLEHATTLIGQSTNRAAEGDATTESKVRYQIQVYQIDQLSPRRTFSMEVQTPKAEAAAADVTTSALAAGGQVLEHSTRTDPDGRGVTHLVLVAPLEKSEGIAAAARTAGTLIKDDSTENAQAPAGAAARARLEIEFSTEPSVVADNNGLFAAIKQGLTTSIRGLLWSVQILVIGLCLIVPWIVAGWAGWRWTRKTRKGAPQ